jgi:uncharacterized protein
MSPGRNTASETIIDAVIAAGARSKVHQRATLEELPRVREAGASGKSSATIDLEFSDLQGSPAVTGELSGDLFVTCQRCMSPMHVLLAEPLQIVLVEDDGEQTRDFGEYEPVVADVHRFDVREFIEEQVLLAMPMIAKHEDERCDPALMIGTDATEKLTDEAGKTASAVESTTQRPFANLRDLLKKQ